MKICSARLASTTEGDFCGIHSVHGSSAVEEGVNLSPNVEENVDFSKPQPASMWAEQGFIVAFDRADKISNHVQYMDGNSQMPDAMEIIFQTALEICKSGGVDELMGNKGGAAAAYCRAKLLLSFIVEEATSLPLNRPFLLTPADRERIGVTLSILNLLNLTYRILQLSQTYK